MSRAEAVRISSVQHQLGIAACWQVPVPVQVPVQHVTAPSLMVSVLTVVRDFHRNQVLSGDVAASSHEVGKNGSTG